MILAVVLDLFIHSTNIYCVPNTCQKVVDTKDTIMNNIDKN